MANVITMLLNREKPQPTNWSIAKRCAIITGFWLFFSAFACVTTYVYNRGMGRPASWHNAALFPFASYIIWTFLIPLVVAFTSWLKQLHLRFLPWLAAHTGFALLAMILWAVAWIPFPQPPDSDLVAIPRPSLHFVQLQFLQSMDYCLWLYWTVVGFVYGIDYYLDGRAARIHAAELEGQLARAELDVLKQQLQPHFLFNTLNSISTLMHTDVDAADDMIGDLSTLLRRSLESNGTHEVSLQQELETLQLYINIQRVRFHDRLTVELNIDPQTLNARVPQLVLQPLVENAFRHGISKRASGGLVRIQSECRNGSLLLRVSDDGPGMAHNSVAKNGIGLKNTLARLQKLYGDHSFLRIDGSGVGFTVELELPFLRKEPDEE
jgi:two-component system, LytTR family, sensor kinase